MIGSVRNSVFDAREPRPIGVGVMATQFGLRPFLLRLKVDSSYPGSKFQRGLKRVCQAVNVKIVKRSDVAKFVVLPRRWIVERAIA